MTRYQFWVDIHAQPAAPLAQPLGARGAQWFETLVISTGLAGTPFAVTFEEAFAGLNGLDQLLIEPDGSFVWSSSHGEPPWQVDGVLYDRAPEAHLRRAQGRMPGGPIRPVAHHLRLAGNSHDVQLRPRSRLPRRAQLPPPGVCLAVRLKRYREPSRKDGASGLLRPRSVRLGLPHTAPYRGY